MELFLEPSTWVALLTLTFLEIVLGIDNIIFISIVSNKLPEAQQAKARNIGLSMALIFRVGLLMGITYIITFTEPLFTLFDHPFSGRDLILLGGGIFLIFKSVMEVHHKMEGVESENGGSSKKFSMATVIAQIILLDIIFSFDSILTAVGLTEHLILMILAVVISMIVMMLFSGKISAFIHDHPTLEILALSFLILIGFMLSIEALGHHVPKGYIYFAVFFSLVVEMINIKMRKKGKPVKLNKGFRG
ncbi:TerC family protein [Fulvivirga lutea]|uniref:TerC family protein n=1 Tax=Fulvivirga lutea TaxID=2810512 RepID=A0A975A147_9BACT|nr:TerC family protein [Fulvivirga lutea]QSE97137.1 TerC family protein [Fulvivirga lutea]